MQFLWHPDQEKQEYLSSEKESSNGKIEESIISVGKYKLTITSAWDTLSLDDESLYTHVVITNDGKPVDTKDYKGVVSVMFTKSKSIKLSTIYSDYVLVACTVVEYLCL